MDFLAVAPGGGTGRFELATNPQADKIPGVRRHDKAIGDREKLDAIIHGSLVCHLAMARDGQPYLVPLSFGYDGQALYLHTAAEGTKIEFFTANPRVCFSFERNVEVRRHPDLACKWSMNFESVIGFGQISELTDPGDRERALNVIMRHYSGREWAFEAAAMARTRLWRISIESVTGKCSQPKPDL